MPVIRDLFPTFDVDDVLRGQGADPAVIRERRPALALQAEQAIQEGLGLLEPRVVYRTYQVAGVRHEGLELEGGSKLKGKLIAQHLAQAKQAHILVCSIGSLLEQYAQEMWADSPTYSLALDGVGSAAVEALANAACRRFEDQAFEHGWQASIPLSPGMIDWPVDEGQPQIFQLLQGEPLEVMLTESMIMLPRKSLTLVLGVGPEMATGLRTCDYCSLKEVCRYQDHYV